MTDSHDVFISHVEEDGVTTEQVARGLEDAGFTTWYYERDMLPGRSHLTQTREAIKASRVVLLVVSAKSFGSPYVEREVLNGLDSAKPFITVLQGVSHVEFKHREPDWADAAGASPSIPIPAEGVAAILPRIVKGLEAITVHPVERREPPPAPAPSPRLRAETSDPLIRVLSGHADGVGDCAISPDGTFVVSASRDRTIRIWDAATGAERATLVGHTDWVFACAVSPDNSLVVSGGGDGTVRIWDASTGAECRTLAGRFGRVYGCAVSPDGKTLVSANENGTLTVWDATSGAELATLSGHADWVNACAFLPDGRTVVSASNDNHLKLWDVATGTERATLVGHKLAVLDCATGSGSEFIVSTSRDGTLKIWEPTGAELRTLGGHEDPAYARIEAPWRPKRLVVLYGCAISGDGSFIASAGGDRAVRLWDTATGAELCTYTGHTNKVLSCAISADSDFVVSASADNTVRIWTAPPPRS